MVFDIALAVLSFLGGWLAGKFLDTSYDAARHAWSIRRRRKNVRENRREEHRDILVLSSGEPDFAPEHLDVKIRPEDRLYLAFPEELRAELPSSAGSFCTRDELFCPITVPGREPEEVWQAVEAARQEVARMFVSREDGLYFNGAKYGVAYSDGFSRTDDSAEDPILTLRLFQTDHFTHRVLSRAAEQLQIDPSLLTAQNLNHELKWLRTSLGLSVLVTLSGSDQILMTRRSLNSSFAEGREWIYVSATETFTETDYDNYTHTADLMLCLKRGIQEELGITPNMYFDSTIRFYNQFFETHFYQDGIVATVELKETAGFDEVCRLRAKDKDLEVGAIFPLDNNKKAIERFIQEHGEEMRSQTLFALRSHAARLRR